ncbi:MAG: hypothetical protein SOY67_06360 [Collinsella sp.]|nr:hypothetical protein [Collinsella sp.]
MSDLREEPMGADAPATETLRIAYLGQDIDAAKELAAWAPGWAASRGLAERVGAGGAPAPLIELSVYAGEGEDELAEAIAFACEGVWAPTRLAALAHVARERHAALLGADLVVDATALDAGPAAVSAAAPADVSAREADDALTLRLDMGLLARHAPLVELSPRVPVADQLTAALRS